MLVSAVRVAISEFDKVTVVVPGGGALWATLKRHFGSSVELINTDKIALGSGKKELLDYVRLISGTIKFLMRHWKLIRNATLVYANGPRQFPAIALLTSWAKVPCIYHVHLLHGQLESQLIAFCARIAATKAVVANSEATHRQLVRWGKWSRGTVLNKLVVIENELSAEFRKLSYRDKYAVSPKQLNLVVIGTIRPEKGQHVVIEMAQRHPELTVHVVGRVAQDSLEYFQRLKSESSANVAFYQELDNVPEFLGRSEFQLCVVPSIAESFGLAAIEAMACSCITLVSKCDAMTEISRKTGAIVFGHSASELDKVLQELTNRSIKELRAISRSQFEKTMSAYGGCEFERKLSGLMRRAVSCSSRTVDAEGY